jgi:spore germination protein KB
MIPNLVFGKAIGVTAGIIVRRISGDVWTATVIGFATGIIIMLLMAFLCSRFPDKTIIRFSEELLGKWVGRGIGVILALFFILAYGASAGTMILHLSEFFLPETPFIIICLIYTLLCMYGVFLGIEVSVRFSAVGFAMLVLISIAMITGTLTYISLNNLLPVFDQGLWANLNGSLYIFGDTAMAILTVGFIFPLLAKKDKAISLTFWAMLAGTLMVIIWPIYEVMVLGPEFMKDYVVVCMQQIRCAQLTRYLPRYELLMVSFFVFSMFVQSGAMFYCSKYAIKQVTNIKKDWSIILPLTPVMVASVYFMSRDHNNYILFLAYPYTQICIALSVGLPLLLFFTALFRGRLRNKRPEGRRSTRKPGYRYI